MGRGDARPKKWGDETQNQKNGETRRKTEKKWGDKTQDKQKWKDKTRDEKKRGRRDAR